MMQRALLVLALAGGAVAHTTITPLSDLFWIYIGICAGLTLVAGLMSGLTLGLLGMDLLYLEVLSKGGEPNTQKYATRIMGLVKRRHWVLVTLLLANSAAMEALPLFLDRLVHPAIAVVISVTVVLMFGEIIPQSVCSKWGLAIGYYTTWFVWILLVLFAPLAWPISKILDLVLGEHGATFYRRSELKELVIAHSRPDRSDMGAPDVEERLSEAQSALISGAIDANEKTIGDCYRPLKETYKLNVRTLLTNDILHEMVAQGHSRIPIWSGRPENLVGLLRVKMLIVQDNLAGRYLRELPLSPLPRVPPTRPLYDMLKDFQTGKSHMVCVEDPVTHDALGIATLEDVIEEILLTEIDQEKDANYTLPPMWITSRGSVYIPKNSQPKVKTPLRRAASHYPTSSTSKSPIAHSNISDTLTLARSPLGHPSPMPSLPTDDRNPLGRSTAAVPSPRPLWRSSSSVVLTAKDEDRFFDKSFMKTSNASVETSPLLPRSDRSIQ